MQGQAAKTGLISGTSGKKEAAILFPAPESSHIQRWNNYLDWAVFTGIQTSILVASPPLTIGTVFPECILYGPIEWPFRFLIGFTVKRTPHRGLINRGPCWTCTQRGDKWLHITLICFPIYLHFIRLHDFLNGLTNVTQAHIDSCKLITERCLHSHQ